MTVSISTVYTLAMPRYVYIQVHGVEKPARIEADKIEKRNVESHIAGDHVLLLSLKDTPVGEFKGPIVDGWWMQDE